MKAHVRAEVLASKRIGAYQHLTLVAPGVGERFRPGSFAAVSVGPAGERARLARRPFWIHQVRPLGGYAATVQLVVEPRGEGSRWLASRQRGDRVEMTGPLGRPFALPKEPVPVLLVGEGVSAAPLFPLAERLRERDCPVSLVLGADDEAHLLSALEARRTARAITVVTHDGSVGARGRIPDVVAEALRRSDAAVVYAAGRAATLAAVAQAAEDHGAWSQVAVEEPSDQPWACCTGLCQGCALPVVGEHGAPREVRACLDGPVLRGDRVRWADL
ncbi:iron-sulfur cluster-binding protein [Nocardioides acrostichi]|uniref:Dihydroorotate dehydrogenase electron transfer subunit n=1 Tax=Nocardioides acrostichi TaxID=2784339 RepID=A0A930V4T5_9ACTN|nr:dihydroorotate dehydrogenase electron transfer subunit [Nocardioides acrostichi]MBF4163189.1 dihydroorotate dehydrogenase electron transfer subunit [Nocardioides acrostichi]